jgi:hypothetical protein
MGSDIPKSFFRSTADKVCMVMASLGAARVKICEVLETR